MTTPIRPAIPTTGRMTLSAAITTGRALAELGG